MEVPAFAPWYVNKNAVEGEDYDPDKIAALWNVTTQQDIFLCTINQQGVNSRKHVPAPYNTGQEDDVEHFLAYYLAKLNEP